MKRWTATVLALLCLTGVVTQVLFASPTLPEGEEFINEKDGSVLVLVREGKFIMGGRGERGYGQDGKARSVELPNFYIGKHAISNRQFRQFVEQTSYAPAGSWAQWAATWGDNAPAVEVSGEDVEAYCRWAGLRLPSVAEWEKAARGNKGRLYPWGNDWNSAFVRCSQEGTGAEVLGANPQEDQGPVSVDSFPEGRSPYGCLHMTGNVSQWCISGSSYAICGGDWRTSCSHPNLFLPAFHSLADPGYHNDALGFRVAVSKDEIEPARSQRRN